MVFQSLGAAFYTLIANKAATSLLTWTVFWLVRRRSGDPTANSDLALLALLEAWSIWKNTAHPLTLLFALHLAGLATILATSRVLPYAQTEKHDLQHGSSVGPEIGRLPMKPMIFQCTTTHSRFFPKKHSFSYSYLYVGIPVGWNDNIGGVLSAGVSRKAWFHVSANSYLQRDYSGHDLRSKLEMYLKSENFPAETVPYAYLVTAPEFLGYSFNPVSFWYLYSADHVLLAMILEVNNTFDERRMYLLKAEGGYARANNSNEVNGEAFVQGTNTKHEKRKIKFSDTWKKDFHVSPFNSREGSYAMIADDPRPPEALEKPLISNSITLLSSEGHPKLVARVFSDGSTIDPTGMTGRDVFTLLVRWGWVGFMTSPRILKEAWKLFFKHKLQVWYRPEVGQGSIARQPTAAERALEKFFCQYLNHMVKHCKVPLTVQYTAAPGIDSSCYIQSAHDQKPTADTSILNLNVTSPAFYSRLVHYACMRDVFEGEFLCAGQKNQTVHFDDISLLTQLFSSEGKKSVTVNRESSSLLSWADTLRWDILRRLRCPPPDVAYADPVEGSWSKALPHEIRPKLLSSLDDFVIQSYFGSATYRRIAVKQFISQRCFYGITSITSILDIGFRFSLLYWTWVKMFGSMQRVLLIRDAVQILSFSVIHAWALLKGV